MSPFCFTRASVAAELSNKPQLSPCLILMSMNMCIMLEMPHAIVTLPRRMMTGWDTSRSDIKGGIRFWMALNVNHKILHLILNWTGSQWRCWMIGVMRFKERVLVTTQVKNETTVGGVSDADGEKSIEKDGVRNGVRLHSGEKWEVGDQPLVILCWGRFQYWNDSSSFEESAEVVREEWDMKGSRERR